MILETIKLIHIYLCYETLKKVFKHVDDYQSAQRIWKMIFVFCFPASMKMDETVDLTHLAPTSGDTCVPLIGGGYQEQSSLSDCV